MNKRTHLAMTALAGLAIVTVIYASHAALRAQGGGSISDGVYTEAQAERGNKVYTEQCGACHGADLKGNDVIPPLTGDGFVANWKDKTAGDLFEKIKTTMPAIAPGSLTPEQTADTMAFILSHSKYKAGATELPATQELLAQIKIAPPNP
jgi:mono/diheme cytochrome c family protein